MNRGKPTFFIRFVKYGYSAEKIKKTLDITPPRAILHITFISEEINMKKITLICLSVLTVVLFALTAVGCGHKHTWTWKTDSNETQHWKVCDECGEGFELKDHVFGEPVHHDADTYYEERTEKYCSTCGYTHVEYVEGTLLGSSYENAAAADFSNNNQLRLKKDITYYIKIAASTKSRAFTVNGNSSLLLVSFEIHADNDEKTLLQEETDRPFGVNPETNVAHSMYNLTRVGGNAIVYLKITPPEDVKVTFSAT